MRGTLERFLLVCLLAAATCHVGPLQAQVTITGTFRYPDGNAFTGKVEIRLVRATVRNICSTPVQVLAFRTVMVRITSGTMGVLSLYPTACLAPADPYVVRVFDSQNVLVYNSRWTVPKTAADVTQLEP